MTQETRDTWRELALQLGAIAKASGRVEVAKAVLDELKHVMPLQDDRAEGDVVIAVGRAAEYCRDVISAEARAHLKDEDHDCKAVPAPDGSSGGCDCRGTD